ncbi:ABC transporter ATP-binding protein [Clostridium sp. AF19-22AC]|jgi:ABC-2 type transport system ATP-binding protein|uniref:ABC transporter ATP-binding protein n=1 Tax=Clostridia TaxID=186801 RepID=UPI000E4CD97E|nr:MULTISPECIES: ABC transporter ATP-binding protein [Clostridia]RHR32360.1 ABC transporter ATP-binding protein [Clostridium sp. AF19-22AC]
MDNLLEIRKLNKSIGSLQLLDINLSLEPGYIMGLIGRNGAGKTSLIKTILRLYQKDSGDIYVNGYNMETEEKEAKNEIGFVLDESLFEDNLSIEANGRLFGSLYSRYDHSLYLQFCERFGLLPKQKAGKLSKGQKTRFQLAFALSHDAKLFLMDEPAAGLDPLFRRELLGYMQDIVESGKRSILFSTHLTNDLDQIGDYIILLDEGSICLELDKEELGDRFYIASGTREQIEHTFGPNVICRLYEPYKSSLLIEFPKEGQLKGLAVTRPSLEDLMYYLSKGGFIK